MSAMALSPARPPEILPLGLVADDLTGALDAAAPFARVGAPVAVLREWPASGPPRASFALDAGTRGSGEAEAAGAAARSAAHLRQSRTAFRKIDSLLRGHPGAEIAATARAGRFASVVVAPAFPAQGRITLQGRQYARHGDGTYRLVDVDLACDLAGRGLKVRSTARAGDLSGAGIFVCDSEYDTDLAAIAAARPRLKPPVLWCGTAGLARALSGGARRAALPEGPCLGIVGSRHATTQAEIAALRALGDGSVIGVDGPRSLDGAFARAAARLAAGRPALVALELPTRAPDAAAQTLLALARAAVALRPRCMFASGGDTLAALCDAAGAARLDVEGEIAPGIPLSRLAGGRWDGIAMLSKSGAFAGGDLLARLFGNSKEKQRVPA